jgi:hypothetical protein
MTLLRLAQVSIVAAALVACEGTKIGGPQATVSYTLVAPLCSSRIPVHFYIDSVQVGTDTFRINVAGEHTTSRGFATSAGDHRLSAHAFGDIWDYAWPEKLVRLATGEMFTDSLQLYCS